MTDEYFIGIMIFDHLNKNIILGFNIIKHKLIQHYPRVVCHLGGRVLNVIRVPKYLF